jgi:tripartite ATP-independent transporter DctP family solute receptor
MKKKIALFLSLCLCVAMMAGCAQSASGPSAQTPPSGPAPSTPTGSTPPRTDLKVSHTLANTEDTHLCTVDMAQRISEQTGGNFDIQVYPNSELGGNVDNLEQMMRGANVMSLMSPDFLATYVADIGILDGPFLFNDYTDFKKITVSDWYAGIAGQMEEKGIKLLSMDWYFGARHLTTQKEVKTPADLKGMRIRSAASPGRVVMTEAMGANPVQMNWAETYSALNQGIVEGCEAPLSTLYSSKIFEVCSRIALTGHIQSIMGVEISDSWFNSIDPSYQKLLTDEIEKTGDILNQRVVESESGWREKLEAEKTLFNEVDKDAFRAACEVFYTKFPEWTPGLYETVKTVLQ